MADAISHRVRYHTVRETGETRADYNEKFGAYVPLDPVIPEELEYIWGWFWDINISVNRAGDGHCRKISFDDYNNWQRLSGEIVTNDEYDILRTMDDAYTTAMNAEISDSRKRQQVAAETAGKK